MIIGSCNTQYTNMKRQKIKYRMEFSCLFYKMSKPFFLFIWMINSFIKSFPRKIYQRNEQWFSKYLRSIAYFFSRLMPIVNCVFKFFLKNYYSFVWFSFSISLVYQYHSLDLWYFVQLVAISQLLILNSFWHNFIMLVDRLNQMLSRKSCWAVSIIKIHSLVKPMNAN